MEQRLVDANKLQNELENGISAGLLIDGYEEYPHINNMDDCVECVKYADTILTIPESPTNGDIIKAMFPNEGDFETDFDADWWNAPWKGVNKMQEGE